MCKLCLNEDQLEEISKFYRVLGEPARLKILCELKCSPSDVQTLASKTGFSPSHISRQLNNLAKFDMVRSEREGQHTIFYADNPLVDELSELVNKELIARLEERMKKLLE